MRTAITILILILVCATCCGSERLPCAHPAVVRVTVQDGRGMMSLGTGVLAIDGDEKYMLTCGHTSSDAINRRVATITTSDGTSHSVRLIAYDDTYDYAIYQSESLSAMPAGSFAQMGDGGYLAGKTVYALGFGSNSQMVQVAGRVRGYTAPRGESLSDWIEVDGEAISGDSGGPIFERGGSVVGILWGSDGNRIIATQINRIRKTLRGIRGTSRRFASLPPGGT